MSQQTSMGSRTRQDGPLTTTVAESQRQSKWKLRWIAAVLATLTMLVVWKMASAHPYIDPDSPKYQALADGRPTMKPFAFRVLDPAAARLFADLTGRPTAQGFWIVALLSGWALLYGVLSSALEQGQDRWLVPLLILLPFWVRNFSNYFLPDLLHAALCMGYLALLQRRRWGWASAMLALMFLARESTILLAAVAVLTLWWLAARRAALLQLAGTAVGMLASKFVARHAYANRHNISDTLYLIGKIPWNLSRNVFGLTLWTDTLRPVTPIRVWTLPHWIPMGSIHQIGYGAYDWFYQLSTVVQLLAAFGLGACIVVFLVWRTPLRKLLPAEEPWLCVAAIYGAVTFLLAPMLGAAMTRLFDYGWPLFLLYLPAIIPRIWRNWPIWCVSMLVALHLVAAWAETVQITLFHFDIIRTFAILIGCNLVAALILARMTSRQNKQPTSA